MKLLRTYRITQMKIKEINSQAHIQENVEYILRDKNGNIKPIFQQNKLYTWAMKKGFLNPFSYLDWGKLDFLLGNWSTAKVVKNTTTNAGFAGVAGRINASGSPAQFDYIAVGTGTTAAAATDTALGTELATNGLSRAQGTTSLVTTTQTNDTAQVTETFSVTGSSAVTEAGLLNASSSGTLLARQVFSAINVVSGDSLQITWKIKVS